ncbi:MAG: hypothetical protein JWN21_189 [Sphingomonas bacterium]|uniref:DUF4440 domain-containing protein n=1 Tax=Sphingomonas bacterium TaxID=1895847 RepID=UPI0026198297|nr:DUF4440 domain-containing protein [Sphingomonas bacterium]MDB5694646.1 hypothetical protein [Sphingomonas bacterium]
MDDDRIWRFEEQLWLGDADTYRTLIDDECVMVLPSDPHVLTAKQAIEAVAHTPRWASVTFTDCKVQRPVDGLIVIAYQADAARDGSEGYKAFCTTTIRRRAHEDWLVVQHSQLPPPKAGGPA